MTTRHLPRTIVPAAALILMAASAFLPMATAAQVATDPGTGNCGIGFNCGCADNGHGCTGYRCLISPINTLLFPWCNFP